MRSVNVIEYSIKNQVKTIICENLEPINTR